MTPRARRSHQTKAMTVCTLLLFQSLGYAFDRVSYPGITYRQDHYRGEEKLLRVVTECRDQLKIQQAEAQAAEAAKNRVKEGPGDFLAYSSTFVAGAVFVYVAFVGTLASGGSGGGAVAAAAPSFAGNVTHAGQMLFAGAGLVGVMALQLAAPATTTFDSTMAGLEKSGLQIPVRFRFNDVNEVANFVGESMADFPGVQTARLQAQCLAQVGARLDANQTAATCNKIIVGMIDNAKNKKLCGRFFN